MDSCRIENGMANYATTIYSQNLTEWWALRPFPSRIVFVFYAWPGRGLSRFDLLEYTRISEIKNDANFLVSARPNCPNEVYKYHVSDCQLFICSNRLMLNHQVHIHVNFQLST